MIHLMFLHENQIELDILHPTYRTIIAEWLTLLLTTHYLFVSLQQTSSSTYDLGSYLSYIVFPIHIKLLV